MINVPLVTIIAVCHNHKSYVVETLDSIRKQTYKNIQCIIINNLKKDGCQEVIEAWLEEYQFDALFIQNENSLSLPKNLNLGLKYTKGKFFQCISCDDILHPAKIQDQVKLFDNSKTSVACVYSDMELIDSEGSSLNQTFFLRYGKNDFDSIQTSDGLRKELGYRCIVPAPSILLRTDVIKNLGGYDEQYDAEDWPMFFKLIRSGFQFKGIQSPLVKYRILEASLAKTINLKRLRTLSKTFHENYDIIPNIQASRRKWLGVCVRIGNYSKLDALYLSYKIILWSKGKAFFDIPYILYNAFILRGYSRNF